MSGCGELSVDLSDPVLGASHSTLWDRRMTVEAGVRAGGERGSPRGDRMKAPDASKTASRGAMRTRVCFPLRALCARPQGELSLKTSIDPLAEYAPTTWHFESPKGRGELPFKPGEGANPRLGAGGGSNCGRPRSRTNPSGCAIRWDRPPPASRPRPQAYFLGRQKWLRRGEAGCSPRAPWPIAQDPEFLSISRATGDELHPVVPFDSGSLHKKRSGGVRQVGSSQLGPCRSTGCEPRSGLYH